MELTNPAWTFLSFVVSVVSLISSILLPIILFIKQSQKALAYEILADTPMLIDTGNAIINGNSLDIRMWNSGKVPILETDHSDSIKFRFGSHAQVRKVGIILTEPPGIHMNPKPHGNSLIFEQSTIRTLNQGDSITLNAQVIHFSGEIETECRIGGVKKIVESPQFLKGSIRVFTLLTVVPFIYFFLTTLFSSLPRQTVSYQNIDLLAVLILWLVWLIRVFHWKLKTIIVILKSFKYISFLLLGYISLHFVVIFILFYTFKIIHS